LYWVMEWKSERLSARMGVMGVTFKGGHCAIFLEKILGGPRCWGLGEFGGSKLTCGSYHGGFFREEGRHLRIGEGNDASRFQEHEKSRRSIGGLQARGERRGGLGLTLD